MKIARGKALQEEGSACENVLYGERAWHSWVIASDPAWWKLGVGKARLER